MQFHCKKLLSNKIYTYTYVLYILKVFTIIFVIEMIWKLIAFGPLTYVKSRWNVFDAVIVIASVAGYLTESGGSFSIFRSLRLVINLVTLPAIGNFRYVN